MVRDDFKNSGESFEGLVYIPPKEDVSILYSQLSEEQKNFLLENLVFCTSYGHNESYALTFNYQKDEGVWYTDIIEDPCIKTFNDIFSDSIEEERTVKNVQLKTYDGMSFTQIEDVIKVTGLIGSYVMVGDVEKFTYYTTLMDITEVQKIAFEDRVRLIIREVGVLKERL